MKGGPPIFKRGRLRRLSPEEIELWLHVTRTVSPRAGVALPEPAPGKAVADATESPPAQSSSAEPSAPQASSKPSPAGPSLPKLAELDRRLRQKLSRGQASVDAILDLHGLRQQEAHTELHRFLLRAQRDGAKVVLVVTGKGEGRDDVYAGTGVLRRSVPLWLRAPEWRSLVVGFEEAARTHGGSGALYVRLRRHDRVSGERRGKM